ncbi:MAG: HPr family phosphocarrier protein [Pyrinomonadaceae bacterium]
MREATLTLTNELGLHARAAAELVKLVGKFESTITLYREQPDVSADARSMLDILYLAATKGVSLKVVVDGDDEETAIDEIAKLFADKFGEE